MIALTNNKRLLPPSKNATDNSTNPEKSKIISLLDAIDDRVFGGKTN